MAEIVVTKVVVLEMMVFAIKVLVSKTVCGGESVHDNEPCHHAMVSGQLCREESPESLFTYPQGLWLISIKNFTVT